MTDLVRRISSSQPTGGEDDPLLTREWLVSNGLGGYASGTIAGVPTRRYHGLLISALPAPFGRTVMLHHLTEIVRLTDRTTIMWDVEPDSAGTPTAQQIEQETLNLTKPGSIILLHPMYQGRDQTRQALKPIIGKLKERGYRFVTVSALLGQA